MKTIQAQPWPDFGATAAVMRRCTARLLEWSIARRYSRARARVRLADRDLRRLRRCSTTAPSSSRSPSPIVRRSASALPDGTDVEATDRITRASRRDPRRHEQNVDVYVAETGVVGRRRSAAQARRPPATRRASPIDFLPHHTAVQARRDGRASRTPTTRSQRIRESVRGHPRRRDRHREAARWARRWARRSRWRSRATTSTRWARSPRGCGAS